MRAVILMMGAVAAVGGCSFDQTGLASTPGDAADAAPGTPDAISIADAPPGVPDAMPDAMCMTSCQGMSLVSCTGVVTLCDLGCSTTGGAHCAALVPSNGADANDDLTGVTMGLDAPGGTIVAIDTDSGLILSTTDLKNWTTVRPAGPGVMNGISYRQNGQIAIFGVDSLTIEASSYVRPFNSRSILFLSRNDVAIAGYLDASGGCTDAQGMLDRSCAGPGGGAGGTTSTAGAGCAGGGANQHATGGGDSGGGGGGFGGNGGNGGDSAMGTKGGGGGKSSSCTGASLVPLEGGAGGGGGGTGAPGGGGGGGVQITSLVGTITIAQGATGTVNLDAGGRGGGGSANAGGGGGGAGGGILLEARGVTLTAANITANGGGGGAGRNATQAGLGGKGSINSATPAAGGADDTSTNGHGHGGPGGAGATNAGNGDGGNFDGGGGGGGAVGRIHFNVPMPTLTITGGVISPAQTRTDPATQ